MTHKIVFALALLLTGLVANTANAGKEGGNGGDVPCEPRMIHIRDEITQWIAGGGPKSLELPPEIPLQVYIDKMTIETNQAQLSCTSKTIKIGGSEKACRNYVDKKKNHRIECNRKLFMDADEDSQYVLIHHEFAGLSGFEANDSGQSKYPLSNQLSAFRESVESDRLSLKKFQELEPYDIFANFQDFVGEFTIIECKRTRTDDHEGCSPEDQRVSIAIYQNSDDPTGKSHFVGIWLEDKNSKPSLGIYPVLGEERSRYQSVSMSYGFYSLWHSGLMIDSSFVWDHELLRVSTRQGFTRNDGIPYIREYSFVLKKISDKPVEH